MTPSGREKHFHHLNLYKAILWPRRDKWSNFRNPQFSHFLKSHKSEIAAHELFCKHCISQGQLILRELTDRVKGVVDWGLGQEQEGKGGS